MTALITNTWSDICNNSFGMILTGLQDLNENLIFPLSDEK